MNPLISVIVPVYNAKRFLSKCIESILHQTHDNLQILLVNDGSTDRSLEICQEYAARDSRVQVLDQPNLGVSAARNHGLQEAKGDYVGFVDSDDAISETLYETLLDRLTTDGSDICGMAAYSIYPVEPFAQEYATPDGSLEPREALKRLLRLSFPTSLWAYLYSQKCIDGLRLNEAIHFFEDFEFNVRVLLRADRISLVSEPLYCYRRNDSSINQQGLSEKQMTCLEIPKLLSALLSGVPPEIRQQVDCFRAHCMISTISGIARSAAPDKDLVYTAKRRLRYMAAGILRSAVVPLWQKLIIVAFLIFPELFPRVLWFTRYRHRSGYRKG